MTPGRNSRVWCVPWYLVVDVLEVFDPLREERTAAGFLRQLPQHEFGFAETAQCARFTRLQANRVDRGFRSLREIEYFLEADEARGVFAVREHHNRLAANLVGILRLHLGELLERNVNGVVQRGGAAGRSCPNGALEIGDLVGEAKLDLDAAVEVHDLCQVLLANSPREANGRILRVLHALIHARAGVDQQR
jgi:hypothetical protein